LLLLLLLGLGAAVGSSVREAEVLLSVLLGEWTPRRNPLHLPLLSMRVLLLLGVQLTTLCGSGGGHTKACAAHDDVPLRYW